jgi:hypothetical protein
MASSCFSGFETRVVNNNGDVLLCRACRDEAEQLCDHGQPVTRTVRHAEDDPALGRPLCVECWDYAGAVLWNAGKLWRRTRIRIYHELANSSDCPNDNCAVKMRCPTSRSLSTNAEASSTSTSHPSRSLSTNAEASSTSTSHPPRRRQTSGSRTVAGSVAAAYRIPSPPEQYTVELLTEAVRNAVAYVKVAGELHWGAPKTDAGRRTVALPGFVAQTLREHQGKWSGTGICFRMLMRGWRTGLAQCSRTAAI